MKFEKTQLFLYRHTKGIRKLGKSLKFLWNTWNLEDELFNIDILEFQGEYPKPSLHNKELTQEQRNGFTAVLKKEHPMIIWDMFRAYCWHERQKEPAMELVVKHMIRFSKSRALNEQCCR